METATLGRGRGYYTFLSKSWQKSSRALQMRGGAGGRVVHVDALRPTLTLFSTPDT